MGRMGELKDYNFWLNFFMGRIKNLSSYKEYLFNFIKTTVHYIAKTVSGSIASFPDGADDVPMLSLKAQIEPAQDLNGYENPWPAGGGANKWDEVTELGVISTTTGEDIASERQIRSKNYIPVNGGETYRVIIKSTATNGIWVLFYDSTKNVMTDGLPSGQQQAVNARRFADTDYLTVPSGCAFIRFYYQVDYGSAYLHDTAIAYPSTVITYSPYSNVCHISGHTGVNVQKRGKNLLFCDASKELRVNGNPARTYQDDGVTIKAASVASYYVILSVMEITEGMVGNTYTLSSLPTTTTIGIFNPSNNNFDTASFYAKTRTITSEDVGKHVAVRFYNDTGADLTWTNCQVELGTTATDYEAFEGETITQEFVDAQGNTLTVYGGESEIVGGALVDNMAIVDMGSLSWLSDSNRQGVFFATIVNKAQSGSADASVNKLVCSSYAYRNASVTTEEDQYVSDYPSYGGKIIFVRDSRFSDTASFKAAVSGVQLCYKLEQPQTHQLTPQEVRTFLGQNNFWADTGDIEITYLSKEK